MTRWDILATQLEALDAALGATLETSDGHTLGYVGEDWTPPASTDAEGHVSFLERAYEHTKDALDRAKKMDDAARERVVRTARKVLDSGKRAAIAVEDKGKQLSQGIADRAHAVKENFANAAAAIAPWYLGIGLGMWVIIGVGAYLVFKSNKSQTGERVRFAEKYTSKGSAA